MAGIAFAATRDLAAAAHTGNGAAGMFGGQVEHVYSFCVSQPCRFMRDFLHLGFNEDEQGRRAFDGILNWVGGGSGGFFNYRFAQPGATHRQHIGRWFPERLFPFANQVLTDSITGTTDGRLRRCLASNTCPKIFEVNSANRYWVKGGSLLHTDTRGNDLSDPPNVRFYFFSSFPHSSREAAGFCQQPGNPVSPSPGLRALLVALDQWTARETEPPPSRLPRGTDGTFVPIARLKLPRIPGVTFNGVMTTGDLFDYGGALHSGILTVLPPKPLGSPYPVLVRKPTRTGTIYRGSDSRYRRSARNLHGMERASARIWRRRSLRCERPENRFHRNESRAADRRRSTLVDRRTLSNLRHIPAGGDAIGYYVARRTAIARGRRETNR